MPPFYALGRVGDHVDELIQSVNIYYMLPASQNINEKLIPSIKVIFNRQRLRFFVEGVMISSDDLIQNVDIHR